MDKNKQKRIIEAAIFAAGEPLPIERITQLFSEDEVLSTKALRELLNELKEDYAERGVNLHEVSSGFRFQSKVGYAPWLARLWEKKPPRYSRALLETLALVAYQQPITRGEIEDVRGVAVSSNIVKTLLEREWVKIVGYKEVPGKPALLATTKHFLDYFGLKSLGDLPPLQELTNLDELGKKLGLQLSLEEVDEQGDDAANEASDPEDATQLSADENAQPEQPAELSAEPSAEEAVVDVIEQTIVAEPANDDAVKKGDPVQVLTQHEDA